MLQKEEDGIAILHFFYDGVFENFVEAYGKAPLPPYIHQENPDKERYQTVYAKVNGSAAAPTAGFHFTEDLLDKIRAKGVEIIPVLLHVGLGTFRPVKVENVSAHKMHSEYYSVSPESAQRINAVRAAGGRIIAVGTTSVRTLESVARPDGHGGGKERRNGYFHLSGIYDEMRGRAHHEFPPAGKHTYHVGGVARGAGKGAGAVSGSGGEKVPLL